MSDLISKFLAEDLAPYMVDSQKAPASFFLSIEDCMSGGGMSYVSEILRHNTTISWFRVTITDFRTRSILFTKENMEGMLCSISSNPQLKVLEVEMSPEEVTGRFEMFGRSILAAAAENRSIEKISLKGWACNYVDEIVDASIVELEMKCIPGRAAEVWPGLPPSVETLKLPWRLGGEHENKAMDIILDKLGEQSAKLRTLHVEGWSWSLPNFLRSSNSILSLHLADVDFRHDEETGCSAMDGLLLGLLGKPTSWISFDGCHFDLKSVKKMVNELQSGSTPIKTLTIFEPEETSVDSSIREFWKCENLDKLEFDTSNDCNVIDLNLELVKERLGKNTLSAVQIPTERLKDLCPVIRVSATSGSLTSLELTCDPVLVEEKDCIFDMLKDEKCQLQHLGLASWNKSKAFHYEGLFQALKENTGLQSLRLQCSCLVDCIVQGLGETLPKMKSLRTLELIIDLSKNEEDALAVAVDKNWSLEAVSVFFNASGWDLKAFGIPSNYNINRPVLRPSSQKQMDDTMLRNKAKKAIIATAPNLSDLDKLELIDAMETYWELPDGLSLAYWLLEKVPDCFF